MSIVNNKYKSLPDGELVSLYKEHSNPDIIGVFYTRYHHLVFAVCFKYLKNEDKANEALFDIFSQLYNYIEKYNITNFKSWLLTVTRNHCLSELKHTNQEVELSDSIQNSRKYFMESDSELTHKREEERKLEVMSEALQQLKPEQKQCIELFFLQEKSYAEIVEITKYDLKKVKSYIQNGKRNLQNIMNQLMSEN